MHLQRAQALGASVRLPERAEPERGDSDEHDDDREKREQELGPHRGRDTPDRTRQWILEPGGERSQSGAYGLSVGDDATLFVISHFPSIFCTSWSAPTTFTSLPVFTST